MLELSAPPVRVLTSEDPRRLIDLSPEWWRVWERDPHATVFASPHWGISWWRHFGQPPLRVLELRAGDRLVGVLPLFRTDEEGPGGPRLLLLGTGNTDHLDPALDPAVADAAAQAAIGALRRLLPEGDVELHQLRGDSPLVRAARAFGWRVLEDESCPVLEIARGAALSSVLSSRALKDLRYARRRLHGIGDISWVSADDAGVPDLLDALFALHGARWSARGEDGVLSDAQTRAFHADVARRWVGQGLRLVGLRIGGRWVAAHYGFRRGDNEQYYIGGYDPESAKLSPGSLMLAHVIEDAIQSGVRSFDFLRGQEPYKYRWGAKDRPCMRVLASAR